MIIGIDPGVSGAVALLHDDLTLYAVEDMPTMANGTKRQVNAAALAKMVLEQFYAPHLMRAVVEQVGAMPGQGVSSMFNFGASFGAILGVLGALQIPHTLVTPAKWKKAAGLIGKDKDMARTLAQQLYPSAPLGRKKDVGRADAILIARFG